MLPLFNDDNIGAVAGNLGIYTKYESVITFLTTIRYWFAFNLERAYQSFNNYVLCVSGPIGMYRIECLEKVIEKWVTQEFLGKRCTYGDDRHLTNQILISGYNVIYTPVAKAITETPSDICRFYRQQTRWSKSAYREFFWSLKAIPYHNILLSVDLLYLLLFPYLVMGYLLYVLWVGNYQQLQLYVIIVMISGLIKTIYGTICNKNMETLFYVLYIIPYVTIVFPAKLWAVITITNTSWGSSFRKQNSKLLKFELDILFLIIWNIMLLSGIGFHIYKIHVFQIEVFKFIPIDSHIDKC
jgi:hyaluronan synthase